MSPDESGHWLLANAYTIWGVFLYAVQTGCWLKLIIALSCGPYRWMGIHHLPSRDSNKASQALFESQSSLKNLETGHNKTVIVMYLVCST